MIYEDKWIIIEDIICIYTYLNENAWRNMVNLFNKGFANNQPMCDSLYIYYLEIIY